MDGDRLLDRRPFGEPIAKGDDVARDRSGDRAADVGDRPAHPIPPGANQPPAARPRRLPLLFDHLIDHQRPPLHPPPAAMANGVAAGEEDVDRPLPLGPPDEEALQRRERRLRRRLGGGEEEEAEKGGNGHAGLA